ncbi:MAG TPA: aminopeptidase, partial [Chloroflexi bacterium]|nr:aminopeptidase [Chloroflexota bacterium]
HSGNLFRDKVAGAVHTINGFGKATGFEQIRELGTIETPVLLTNTLNVGLAADALVAFMLRDNPDIGVTTGGVNPVVGECHDGYLSDLRGRHVRAEHVWAALEGAREGPVEEGNVGAGTGTQAFEFKGGIGTASRRTLLNKGGFTVGALVQTNFGRREELTVAGVPAGRELVDVGRIKKREDGSIMMVVATDAPCSARQLHRLAVRAGFGLARTGSVAAYGSGDFVIAFSTTNRRPQYADTVIAERPRLEDEAGVITALFQAVVESVEEAIINALLRAETLTGRDGNTLFAVPIDRLQEILRRYGRL